MASTSGRYGYPVITNDDPMEGPAQITAAAGEWDSLLNETASTVATLPPTSERPAGHHVWVIAESMDFVNTATGWQAAGPLIIVDGGKSGAKPATARTIVQTGRVAATTGGSGVLPTHAFPTPFPGGVTSIQILLSSGAASGLVLNGDALSLTGFTAILNSGTSGIALTYYYTAYGW